MIIQLIRMDKIKAIKIRAKKGDTLKTIFEKAKITRAVYGKYELRCFGDGTTIVVKPSHTFVSDARVIMCKFYTGYPKLRCSQEDRDECSCVNKA